MTLTWKLRTFVLGLVVIGLVGWVAAPAFTEEGEEAPAGGGDPMAEFWESLGKKGEHHEWIKFLAGSWTTENKHWMGPGEPQTSKGKATSRLIMDGRFVRMDYEGEWEGTTFQGEGTIGFNNHTKKFENVWMDSTSTNVMHDMGERKGDKLVFTGTQPTHMGEVPTKSTLTKVSDDEYVYESVWNIPGMGEFKVMELRYKRVK